MVVTIKLSKIWGLIRSGVKFYLVSILVFFGLLFGIVTMMVLQYALGKDFHLFTPYVLTLGFLFLSFTFAVLWMVAKIVAYVVKKFENSLGNFCPR